MNLALATHTYIKIENRYLDSQLLGTSGDGKQKLCEVTDNSTWQQSPYGDVLHIVRLNNDPTLKINFENQSYTKNL